MTYEEFKTRYEYNPATDKLGEGGFGSVFKVYDTYRDRQVALKIAKVLPDFESVRLKKEVEMVNALPVHPNIAYYEECYTFSSFDGEYDFAILQFYREGNLMQLIRGKDVAYHLSTDQKNAILTQILQGLDFLHQNGIIHRDLKPQNILMVKRQDGTFIPKITDFGISKKLDANRSALFSNSLAGAGTLSYSSPEQLGEREIRKNTDLWSFGIIAFQMLTGKLPFTTGNHATTSEAGRIELFSQINRGELPAEINSLPERWQTLIRQCLITDSEKRLRNCKEALDILNGKIPAAPEAPQIPQIPDEKTIIEGVKTEDKTLIEQPKPVTPPKEERKPKAKPDKEPKKEKEEKPVKKFPLKPVIGVTAGVIVALLAWWLITGQKPNLDKNTDVALQSDTLPVPQQTETALKKQDSIQVTVQTTVKAENEWEKEYETLMTQAGKYCKDREINLAKEKFQQAQQLAKTNANKQKTDAASKGYNACTSFLQGEEHFKSGKKHLDTMDFGKASTYFENAIDAFSKAKNSGFFPYSYIDELIYRCKDAEDASRATPVRDKTPQQTPQPESNNTSLLAKYDMDGQIPFGSFKIVQRNSDKKWGIIDSNGNEKCAFIYDQTFPLLKNGHIALKSKGQGWDVYNSSAVRVETNIEFLDNYK